MVRIPPMPPTEIVAVASALVTSLFGLWIKSLKEHWDEEKKRNDQRAIKQDEQIKENATDIKRLTERLHEEQLTSVRLAGELKLAQQATSGVAQDLKAIEESMVTRKEWEARMDGVDAALETIAGALRVTRGSGSTPNMPATR